jgi:signal transduction histidine kinase
MLDISRISSGKFSMTLEQFDLCAVVRDLVERSADQFAAAGCAVEIVAGQAVFGNWDRFRIEQVVMNLLTNAMRYGSGKPILVQVNASATGAQITVRDQGRGIAEENHQRIFQRYERILAAHHGSIRVESHLNQGSCFVVELPQLLCAA